jgi:hypothetical protein
MPADKDNDMQVVLYRKTKQNQLYYYSIDDRQQSLFHPHAITVHWGSTPEGGRERQYFFASEKEKNRKIRSILVEKLKNYDVLYSYFKDRGASRGEGGAEDLLSRIS